jgi:hypothetical protein
MKAEIAILSDSVPKFSLYRYVMQHEETILDHSALERRDDSHHKLSLVQLNTPHVEGRPMKITPTS